MNPVIMNLKIRLAGEEKRLFELKLKAVRLLNEILQLANPYFGDKIELIKSEEMRQAATELCVVKDDLTNCEKNIQKLKEDIGDE